MTAFKQRTSLFSLSQSDLGLRQFIAVLYHLMDIIILEVPIQNHRIPVFLIHVIRRRHFLEHTAQKSARLGSHFKFTHK